jgi:hypothetical protein
MDVALPVLIGLGLAAACGFRVFVPMFILSLVAQGGGVTLVSPFEWMASPQATVAFGVASALEVLAYYFPWVDNLLDITAGPAATVAGVIVAASVIIDVPPLVRWTLAIIAGGGAAGLVQGATTAARAGSTVTTAGFGNPAIATGELVGSSVTSILAVTVPVLCALLVTAFLVVVVRRTRRLVFWSRRRLARP